MPSELVGDAVAILQLDTGKHAIQRGCSAERLAGYRASVVVLRDDGIDLGVACEMNGTPAAHSGGGITNEGCPYRVINTEEIGITHG